MLLLEAIALLGGEAAAVVVHVVESRASGSRVADSLVVYSRVLDAHAAAVVVAADHRQHY